MARKEELLSATVSVEDKASKQFDRITKSVQKQNNEILRLKASMDKLKNQSTKKMEPKVDTKPAVKHLENLKKAFEDVHKSAQRVTGMFSGIRNGLSGLNPGLMLGGAGALGGMYAGKQVFDNTFLPAAQYEMSAKTIEAMFNNKQKSEQYMKEMEAMAINSPLLNSGDIFGNSKSFIAMSKDIDQLETMWKLSERLLAVDPTQGVEGSVFALRELFSGDAISMARRFEMPKKELNAIAKLPIDKQLTELDKLFNKMGMTNKLITSMGDTTLGTWNQIKETIQVAGRKIGDPAVQIIKPFLKDANKALQGGKLSPYVKFGQDMAKGIAKGFIRVAKGVGGWIDRIVNNPEFQKLDTIEQKFQFVLDQVYLTFDGWYEKQGKVLLEKIGTGLVDSMITGISNNLPRIVEMGLNIGSSLVKGVMNALDNWAVNNPIYASLIGIGGGFSVGGVPGAIIGGGAAVTTTGVEDIKRNKEKSWAFPRIHMPSLDNLLKLPFPKKAVGMSRVPRNDYPALLHEGEEIRTKQQVNSDKVNRKGSGVVVQIAQLIVREEADVKKIADQIAFNMERDSLNFAGGGF